MAAELESPFPVTTVSIQPNVAALFPIALHERLEARLYSCCDGTGAFGEGVGETMALLPRTGGFCLPSAAPPSHGHAASLVPDPGRRLRRHYVTRAAAAW